MKRFAPAVRALCERVRRPTGIRILMGMALIAPAVLISAGNANTRDGNVSAQTNVPSLESPTKPVDPNAAQRLLGAPAIQAPAPASNPFSLMGSGSENSTAVTLTAAGVDEADQAPTKLAREYKISQPLADKIHSAAVAHGISPRTAFGLVRAESGFRTRAVSPVGAVGLTQIMPSTARWLKPGTTRRELLDPSFNLSMGFRYLSKLIDDYDGNERMALTAFNRGPGTVNRLLRRGRNPDNGYADKVLTGKSAKHVSLMNAKFRRKRSS
jgi:soluble lytic murein transglycosylase-like protein